MTTHDGLIALGKFGRAHGLKGEVRLKSFTANPVDIAAYGPLQTKDKGSITLTSVRSIGDDMLVVRVQGVTDRSQADALNRVQLFVPRERLPAPEDEDEFLYADLIGLAVVDEAGETLGHVMGLADYGAGDIIEIAPVIRGPSILLPFTKACVPVVDIPAKRLVVARVAYESAKPELPSSPQRAE